MSIIFYRQFGNVYSLQNASTLSSLTYYWPVVSGQLMELVQGANLICIVPANAMFVSDRLNVSGDAARITNSSNYLVAPPGVYFAGDFTITLWYATNVSPGRNWPHLIDFGNGPESDNVVLVASQYNDNMPIFRSLSGASAATACDLSVGGQALALNQWYHLAVVQQGGNMVLYIDGVPDWQLCSFPPRAVNRTQNYFGYSPWLGADLIDGSIDEVKFFGRALAQSEVQTDMAGQGVKLVNL